MHRKRSPTALKHEAILRWVENATRLCRLVGGGTVMCTRSPFDIGQKGLRQGRSEKPHPTPEKSPQMRTGTGNTRGLSWRNMATISEKQRMFLSCPDWLAEGARFELADPLRGLQFSRLARSAAPSPLHTTLDPTRSLYGCSWQRDNDFEYLILF